MKNFDAQFTITVPFEAVGKAGAMKHAEILENFLTNLLQGQSGNAADPSRKYMFEFDATIVERFSVNELD